MRKNFSKSWIKSKQPRRQRKYRANATLHIRHKFLGSRLSKELTEKYGKRTMPIRKNDTVKVLRGQFKGKSGKIESVDTKKSKVIITGIDVVKKDGTKTRYLIHASNLVITALSLEDKKRAKKLKKEGAK